MASTTESFRGRKLGQNRQKPCKYQVQISGNTFEVLRGSLLLNKLPRLQIPRVQTFGKRAKGGGNPYFGQTSPTTTHINSLRCPQQIVHGYFRLLCSLNQNSVSVAFREFSVDLDRAIDANLGCCRRGLSCAACLSRRIRRA
jgi:hypothetical protein